MAVSFPAAVTELLHRPIVVATVTINGDGSPQLTYLWYEFDGERFYLSTTSDRKKSKNLQRDPRLTLGFLDPDNPYRYVTVQGRASFTTEAANDLIWRLSIRYLGPEKGEVAARNFQGPNRINIIVDPEQFYTWGF